MRSPLPALLLVATVLLSGCATSETSTTPTPKDERVAEAPLGSRIKKRSRGTAPVSGVSGSAMEQERVNAAAAMSAAANAGSR